MVTFSSQPSTFPITQATYDAAQQKLLTLQKNREEILIRLQLAREQGDLSENGAYHAAKFELRNTDREIREQHRIITFGVITTKSSTQTVGFGCTVTLLLDQKEVVFTLVGKLEANPQLGNISIESPLGQALMGKKVKDEVKVSTPGGVKEYTILKIE